LKKLFQTLDQASEDALKPTKQKPTTDADQVPKKPMKLKPLAFGDMFGSMFGKKPGKFFKLKFDPKSLTQVKFDKNYCQKLSAEIAIFFFGNIDIY